jgi:hypothetical protein
MAVSDSAQICLQKLRPHSFTEGMGPEFGSGSFLIVLMSEQLRKG